jgi:CheY-like chemotaxis protein
MKSDVLPAAKNSSTKILLVDGSQNGLTARGMILREQGYTVETVRTGEEAWELVQKTNFDILVAAYALKGMSGAELASKVHGAGLAARIILLMTHAESLSLDADQLGADETISKSNREVAELLRAVKRLAEGKPKRRPPATQKGPGGARRRQGARSAGE